jgi:hypothetical protein
VLRSHAKIYFTLPERTRERSDVVDQCVHQLNTMHYVEQGVAEAWTATRVRKWLSHHRAEFLTGRVDQRSPALIRSLELAKEVRAARE